jgi:hypothetical protein
MLQRDRLLKQVAQILTLDHPEVVVHLCSPAKDDT